jgi:hypothetical protein
MESILKIGDKVRVGDKIGEAIRLDQGVTQPLSKLPLEKDAIIIAKGKS